MTISGVDALFFTVAFLVPGFVWQAAMSAFVPRKSEDVQLSFLRFLSISCVNYGLWSWLVFLITRASFSSRHPVIAAMAWFVVVFLSPAALGALCGHYTQRDAIRQALQRIGLSPLHVIPTAWDYKFSRTAVPEWILVTFKDGSQVAGWFGSDSFASSETGERDLFIQEVYTINLEGSWEPVEGSAGILIRQDEIKHIEFRNN